MKCSIHLGNCKGKETHPVVRDDNNWYEYPSFRKLTKQEIERGNHEKTNNTKI